MAKKDKVKEELQAEEQVTEEQVVAEEEEVTEEKQEGAEGQDKLVKEYMDRLQRTMAEFDNFRKRTIKEKSQMYENGTKETLEKLLPIVDNFERALSSVSEEEKELPFTQGVEMIFKQLMGTLNELGVEPIEAAGKEFDPNLHHAVTHAEDDEFGDNTVAEEFQKGYMYKDAVLRHSMVKVVN